MRIERSQPFHQTKDIILIQCEGSDTEYNYFLGLRGHCGRDTPFRLVPKRGEGGDAVEVVKLAVKEKENAKRRGEPYNSSWCVLDVERSQDAAKLTKATALAAKNRITLCLSNPCFEVWLIAHFEAIARPFPDCSAAERYLNRTHWPTVSGIDYDKADPNLYQKIKPLLRAAVTNAQLGLERHPNSGQCRDCNSSTEVYKLVREYLPPEEPPA